MLTGYPILFLAGLGVVVIVGAFACLYMVVTGTTSIGRTSIDNA